MSQTRYAGAQRHLGLYAYRVEALLRLAALDPESLASSLEEPRWDPAQADVQPLYTTTCEAGTIPAQAGQQSGQGEDQTMPLTLRSLSIVAVAAALYLVPAETQAQSNRWLPYEGHLTVHFAIDHGGGNHGSVSIRPG